MNKGKILCEACIIFIALSLMPTLASAADIIINTPTTWDTGSYAYDNVLITNTATLTFNGTITLSCANLTIDFGSSISAGGKGYTAGQGPGAGLVGNSGGSYGGEGGKGYAASRVPTYGSAIAPVDLGSGGGKTGYSQTGGPGGGAIRLIIDSTLTLNGKISANGSNGGNGAGGGSGGSIYVTCNTLTGSGSFTANGGEGGGYSGGTYGSGGGGGRIAVYYQSCTFPVTNAQAIGGLGRGGMENGNDGTVGFFDTLNNNLYIYKTWRFQENDSPFTLNNVVSTNASRVTTSGNINLTANGLIVDNGSSLIMTSSAAFRLTYLTVSGGSALTLSGRESLSVNTINVTGNNSVITHSPGGNINLNLPNLTIDSGSSISADGKGYTAGQGPGAGLVGNSGGSYGGEGGKGYAASRVPTYGSAIAPVDLGSGGGKTGYSQTGGPGGGSIRLIVSDTLTLNGKISANGSNGGNGAGGGSGGSIYVTSNTLTGSGSFTANGGEGGGYSGGTYGSGGGGGRIAVYYQTSSFPITNTTATGGRGLGGQENGRDGTVIFQGSLPDSPLTFFTLFEKSSTISTSSEILSAQGADLINGVVTGDLTGSFNITDLEIITVTSGPFVGKGFSEGKVTINLEGLSYNGNYKGIIYPMPSEKRIYLKGEITGDNISGIVEGYLVESTPESGIYDKYEATWKLNRLATATISASISLEGILTYGAPHTFTSDLYIYQANMEGSAYLGFYTGPLNAVVTHLRLTDENEYRGEGISIISFNTVLGQGEGWAYNYLIAPGKVEFQGLFKEPLLGKLSATLDENKSPKTLSGTIERLDLGVAPAPDLKVKVWGPERVSPGQKVDYIIEYRNDGLKAAGNVFISCYLDNLVKYISASQGVYYSPYAHRLSWKIENLPAKTIGYLTFKAEVAWGLPEGFPLWQNAYITNIGE